jgi:hypothetical protein
LGKFENAYKRFMAKPYPKDIQLAEVEYLARALGFIIKSGGKHPIKIVNPVTDEGYVVPVRRGQLVYWVYVKELQKIFREKMEEGQP